jgi:hypothetical protein
VRASDRVVQNEVTNERSSVETGSTLTRRYSVVVSTTRIEQTRVIKWAAVAVAALGLGYLAWFGLLCMGSTEGDTPAASSLSLPDDATVLTTDEECGSGGCWSIFTVRPSPDATADELARHLTAAFEGRIPGTFADPRTINIKTDTQGPVLVITASYWATYSDAP